MMKKVIIFLFLVISLSFISQKKQNYIIPHESIRFRIVANSNNVEDQVLKMEVRTALLPILDKISTNSSSLISARQNIEDNLSNMSSVLSKYVDSYDITFGQNYFPPKQYRGIDYEAGEYESLVIRLGQGLGDNWWCVLFPPLCLLEATNTNMDDVSYEYYFKKIINQYF